MPAPSDDRLGHAGLERIETVSRVLDDFVRIPGTNIRFGLDPILGIFPIAGDSVAALLSAYIIFEGYRADAPVSLLAKMVALVTIDTLVGSVPILGTLFDVFWKANRWNVEMLSAHLETEAVRKEI